jgi:HD-GYP domain-containing protein (c-di-GMP phosphodiesterase class II)
VKEVKVGAEYSDDLIQLDYIGDLGMSEMIGLMRLHVQEVTRFTTLIAHKLTLNKKQWLEFKADCESYQINPDPFITEVDETQYHFSTLGIFLLKICAKVHDIGKPLFRSIYRLERSLTDEEFNRQKLHADLTRMIVCSLLLDQRYQWKEPQLVKMVADCAAAHQEKMDGSGYPDGAKGTEIPLIGRLLAISDALSAIINPRPYQKETPLVTAIEWITRDRGSHFDPQLLDGAIAVIQQERYSAQRFSGSWEKEAGFTQEYSDMLNNISAVEIDGASSKLLTANKRALMLLNGMIAESLVEKTLA